MTNANPALDPANNDSLTGVLRHVWGELSKRINSVLPAQVLGFKRGNPSYVQVQPLIKMVTTNNEFVSRASIAQIPVYQMGAGGWVASFNINPGDQGLIIACDRDISLFVQNNQESPPNTIRRNNFADSFFLPMVMRNVEVAEEDAENFVIQNLDGSMRLAFQSDRIKMTCPIFEINGDVLINGELNTTERCIVQGDIASGGNITAAGTITPGVPIPP